MNSVYLTYDQYHMLKNLSQELSDDRILSKTDKEEVMMHCLNTCLDYNDSQEQESAPEYEPDTGIFVRKIHYRAA